MKDTEEAIILYYADQVLDNIQDFFSIPMRRKPPPLCGIGKRFSAISPAITPSVTFVPERNFSNISRTMFQQVIHS
ncbi:hypothetical protein J6590_000715 [Homalodisca vitripennis]|nr:hypothetical protein J6590_000715 [Homalodisca vitripennis]